MFSCAPSSEFPQFAITMEVEEKGGRARPAGDSLETCTTSDDAGGLTLAELPVRLARALFRLPL